MALAPKAAIESLKPAAPSTITNRAVQQQVEREVGGHRTAPASGPGEQGKAAGDGPQPSPQGRPSRYQATRSSGQTTHSTTM